MADKNYKGAPFGVQTARFDVSGIHPKNKTPGTFTQTPYCKKSNTSLSCQLGPGRYDIGLGGFSDKSVEERAGGPGWARAYEVQRLAALPHLLHKQQWELKRLLKKKLGPGSYNIKDFLEQSGEKPRSTLGIIHTKEERFKEKLTQAQETPGPGTYGEGGVPHAAVEEKAKKSASTIGLLGASGAERSLPTVGSGLGPGTYQFKSFTEKIDEKVTSLRGPYDLFSGDRNKPIKTGHLASVTNSNLGPGQYKIKSFVDDWSTEHKQRTGRFFKMEQYPEKAIDRIYSFSLPQNPRNREEPGPGQYEPKMADQVISHAKKSPGFLSSSQRSDKLSTKFFTGNQNPVGPGRYVIQKLEDAQHRNGHTSVFKSKSLRPEHTRSKFLQERIRSKDVAVNDRCFMVTPDPPNYRTCDFDVRKSTRRSLTVA
ncbi:hypothetical protein CAPTEDRAFT_226751 [Capitella teleta]|uniref:Lymphocyte expansion molecule n=1 Tax=Capitella teleta TaxID=283909 RepID=N1PB98_CAPTE|nr:hypothetical protein CAPTEDRAFT_226751 [Capitella teleta]|eukprot:ELU18830.1 hypothetical protein CAPTEDRAFT_226751 [Capitella teleta]